MGDGKFDNIVMRRAVFDKRGNWGGLRGSSGQADESKVHCDEA